MVVITRVVGVALRVFIAVAIFALLSSVILFVLAHRWVADIDQHRLAIESFIDERVGLSVELGPVSAQWTGLTPAITVENIQIGAGPVTPTLLFSGWQAHLDLLRSLKHGALIWHEFSIQQLDLALEEDQRGNWRLRGLSGGGNAGLDIILDPLLYSRSIQVDTMTANLTFYSGMTTRLLGSTLRLENDADFHRAELSLMINDGEVPAYLVIEGHGDPLDLETFEAQGYIKMEAFDLSQPSLEVAKRVIPEVFADSDQVAADANGEIWFDIHPGGTADFEGYISLDEMAWNGSQELAFVDRLRTDITGWYTPRADWGVRLQSLELTIDDQQLAPVNLIFAQSVGDRWEDFTLSLDRFDLGAHTALLEPVWSRDEALARWLRRLQLTGSSSLIHLGKKHGKYFAQGQLKDVGSLPFKGIPGVDNLDGYFEVRDQSALLELRDENGFTVDFQNIFAEPLSVASLRGDLSIAWRPASKSLHIGSDVMQAVVDAGSVNVQFSTRSQIPSLGIAPEVNIVLGGRNIDAAQRAKYLPEKLSIGLKTWLEEALVKTDVRELGYALRTGDRSNTPISKTNQLYFKVEDTTLNYHPKWVQGTRANGIVLADDSDVHAIISRASIGQVDVLQADVRYVSQGVGGVPHVLVDAELASPLPEAIEILRRSPIQSAMGSLANWHYQGEQFSHLQLDIPLNGSSAPSEGGNKSIYEISTRLQAATIAIPKTALKISEIAGDLSFTSERGFYSDTLHSRFWGHPMTAQFVDDDEQLIKLKGIIEPDKISQLVPFQWSEILHGNIPIDGLLRIQRSPFGVDKHVDLRLTSDMSGVSIVLPEPLGKPAESPRDLDVLISFGQSIESVKGTLGTDIDFDMRYTAGSFDRGYFSYNRATVLPNDAQMLFSGYLPQTRLESWQPLIELIGSSPDEQEETLANGNLTRPSMGWESIFDLKFDRLTFADIALLDVTAQIDRRGSNVHVAFDSHLGTGRIEVPKDGVGVPNLHLTQLVLDSDSWAGAVGAGALDPRKFPDINVHIERLLVDQDHWGDLGFDLRSEVSGAIFGNIRSSLFGLTIGMDETLPPTEFFWHHDGLAHTSRFIGPVSVTDIGSVLSNFGLPIIADSESGALIFDLNWQDQPWNFARHNLSGEFKFELADGSFYSSPGGADTALKMISLFNFANWLRRLQLDFSDVVGQNLAYNDVSGRFAFDQGVAQLVEPLQMQMPSGRMSMAGRFDLMQETLDGQLVATLPVATNLPWVGALMGGLPAALGVYLTGKVLERQVNRLSSISYSLSGDWDDIEVDVDKIFAAALKSEMDKEKAR